MRSISVLFVCSLASACWGEEVACDSEADDQCVLLQGSVGIVSQHGGDKLGQQLAKKGQQLAEKMSSGEETDKGFPDFFKKLKAAVSGTGKLEHDFDAVKIAVGTFSKEVHAQIAALLTHAKTGASLENVRIQVEATLESIHQAALKLWAALTKASATFLSTVGKVAPAKFTSSMKSVLDKATHEAKSFADSFKHGDQELKKVNRTSVCTTVKHHLDAMHKKAEDITTSTLGLTTKGLSKDVLKAKDALPSVIKSEVDKVLHKANEAAEAIKGSLLPTVKEISHGIASAFKGQCHGLESGAGRPEVSLLAALVLVLLGFSM